MMKSELARFGRGFVYAWNGILKAVREERNFRFHICAAVYVFAAAVLAEFDAVRMALIAMCVFAVMAMELVNSAIERAVDKPDTTHWWSAGAAKDMAAGAVLVTALGAACVGAFLFFDTGVLPKLWQRLCTAPAAVILLLASLPAAYFFVFRLGYAIKEKEGPPYAADKHPQKPPDGQ